MSKAEHTALLERVQDKQRDLNEHGVTFRPEGIMEIKIAALSTMLGDIMTTAFGWTQEEYDRWNNQHFLLKLEEFMDTTGAEAKQESIRQRLLQGVPSDISKLPRNVSDLPRG